MTPRATWTLEVNLIKNQVHFWPLKLALKTKNDQFVTVLNPKMPHNKKTHCLFVTEATHSCIKTCSEQGSYANSLYNQVFYDRICGNRALAVYLFSRAWRWYTHNLNFSLFCLEKASFLVKKWCFIQDGILMKSGALLPQVWYSILYYHQSDLLNLHNHESYISASVEKNGREKNPPAYRLSSSVFRNRAPSFPSLRPLGLILLILKMWHGDVCPSWKNVHNHSSVQTIVARVWYKIRVIRALFWYLQNWHFREYEKLLAPFSL